jgi:hypothetical protein
VATPVYQGRSAQASRPRPGPGIEWLQECTAGSAPVTVIPRFPSVGLRLHKPHPVRALPIIVWAGLSLLIAAAQVVTGLYRDGSHTRGDARLAPRLTVPVHCAVVTQHLRQYVPLAAGVQVGDNPVQHRHRSTRRCSMGLMG